MISIDIILYDFVKENFVTLTIFLGALKTLLETTAREHPGAKDNKITQLIPILISFISGLLSFGKSKSVKK